MKALNRIFLLLSLLTVFSCDDIYKSPWYNITDNYNDRYYYILNNGSWGMNDASMGCYDRKNFTYYSNVFQDKNEGQKLGDLGQDMIQYGGKIYIAVSGSKTIFVTDKSFKILKKLNPDDCQPRSLVAREGKVYVSLYEGYLGEIDTLTYAFRKTKVGANPEGVVVYKDKICVANSGGMNAPNYGNTVMMVDPKTLEVEDSIEVNINPVALFAREKYLYIQSMGDFNTVEPKFEVYMDGKLMDTDYKNVSMVCQYEEAMYILTDAYTQKGAKIYMHNAATNGRVGSFLPEAAILTNAYSISATRYFLWVGCSDYKTTGDILLFDRLFGNYCANFDSQGLNPQKVIEVL